MSRLLNLKHSCWIKLLMSFKNILLISWAIYTHLFCLWINLFNVLPNNIQYKPVMCWITISIIINDKIISLSTVAKKVAQFTWLHLIYGFISRNNYLQNPFEHLMKNTLDAIQRFPYKINHLKRYSMVEENWS